MKRSISLFGFKVWLAVGVSLLMAVTSCSKKEKVSLQTATVSKGEITELVTATGTLECITQVDVGTQVTGIVAKLYADFNSIVTEGQLIAEIDKTTLEAELQSADAQLESARLDYEYNKKNYERDEALHQKQLISDYEYETSMHDYLVSKANYERMQANRISAARNLSYAEITSPMDGIVISFTALPWLSRTFSKSFTDDCDIMTVGSLKQYPS